MTRLRKMMLEDRTPFGGCHQGIDLLKPPACCSGCIGTVPNSHHVLIMLSSLNVSRVLDSPVSATDVEIKPIGETKCQRRVQLLTPVLHM